MSGKIRVVVIDDHLVTREGIVSLLAKNSNIEVVGQGWVGKHVMKLAVTYQPDVMITDLQMPASVDGPKTLFFEPVSGLKAVIEKFPEMAVIVISQEQNVYTIQGLSEVGVKGYFLKNDDIARSLGSAVEKIKNGTACFSPAIYEVIHQAPKLEPSVSLTDRETDILRALLRSPETTQANLARLFNISTYTVDKNLRSIREKFGFSKTASCVLVAMRMGLLDDAADPHQAERQ